MQALSELAKSAEFLVVEKMTYIDDGNAPFRAAAAAAVLKRRRTPAMLIVGPNQWAKASARFTAASFSVLMSRSVCLAAGAAVFGEHFGIGRRSHAHAGATGTERQAREAAEIAG